MSARRWYPFYYSQIRRLYQHKSGQIHVAQASDGFETYLDWMPRSSRFCFKAGVGPNFATGLSDTRDRYYLWERTGSTGQVVPVRSRAAYNTTEPYEAEPDMCPDPTKRVPACSTYGLDGLSTLPFQMATLPFCRICMFDASPRLRPQLMGNNPASN